MNDNTQVLFLLYWICEMKVKLEASYRLLLKDLFIIGGY
jgi:hypothetical protein